MRPAAVALALALLAGCIQQSRTLLPDIPLPPEMTATAVEDPARWTRLRPVDVIALAKALDGSPVGAKPVVRFLWLKDGPRPFSEQDRPVWIVVSDDLPMPRPIGDVNAPVVDRSAGGITWAWFTADGESLGWSSMSSPGAAPSLPPP